jgi:hypothetical protein
VRDVVREALHAALIFAFPVPLEERPLPHDLVSSADCPRHERLERIAPNARMKRILTEAVAVANATSRSLLMNPREPDCYYYHGSAWMNFLFISGSEFETPIPLVTRDGVKPFPPTGYRTLDARTGVFLRRHRHHARNEHCPCLASARNIS